MSIRFPFAAALVVALGAATPALRFQRPTPGPDTPDASIAAQTSTADDQKDLAVTVYNSDLALIRDTREIPVAGGTADLKFMDIAATVNPATVHFRSLTDPSRLSVLEQNYEYDLLDPAKLLHKYVGRDVTLVRPRSVNGTTQEENVTARLLSDNGAPVWQIGNEIVTGIGADHIKFPDLPGNLYSRPTLIWTLDNTGATRQRVEASYLATGLAWNADYVLTVARDDKSGDLDGWVTLRNNSGTALRNTTLQLIAGNLNRVGGGGGRGMSDSIQLMERAAAAPAMTQEAFSDYHLYTLQRKTTINNAESKQVSMLEATRFPVEKRYTVNGQNYYYRNTYQPGAPIKDVVHVSYRFKNESSAGLGMPLPAGTVRVYQADSHDGLQFVGEDRIDHTPKDETLNLNIGTAFDVVCERKQTDFQRISTNVFEVAFEITLRNHKTSPIVVEANEPLGGTWRMIQASAPWTKTDAWAAQFNVPVAADGTTTLTYRVRITY